MNSPENGQVGQKAVDEICKVWTTTRVKKKNDTILKVRTKLLLGQSVTEDNCWGLRKVTQLKGHLRRSFDSYF